MCISDPREAEALLRSKQVDPREISSILAKYSKEAKRLQVDIRQERERKYLSIRHRLESELVDVLPANVSGQLMEPLLNSVIPPLPSFHAALAATAPGVMISGVSGGNVTVNLSAQTLNAVNSVVTQELDGASLLTEEDRRLMVLIQEHAGPDAAELTSAVREVADPATPAPERVLGVQRLKGFLAKAAGKVGDIGVSLLTKYLEHKLGL
jgi:hypothetical protein